MKSKGFGKFLKAGYGRIVWLFLLVSRFRWVWSFCRDQSEHELSAMLSVKLPVFLLIGPLLRAMRTPPWVVWEIVAPVPSMAGPTRPGALQLGSGINP